MRSNKRQLSPSPVNRPPSPGTPGPHVADVERVARQQAFLGASPASTARLPDLRRQLFMAPITRTQAQHADETSAPSTSSTAPLSQDIVPLEGLLHDDEDPDNLGEPQDATPRRQPARRKPRDQPEVEDVLTHLTNTLVDVQRNLRQAQEAAPAPAQDHAPDPHFNWNLLRTPAETRFPVPGLESVQGIAADLLARLLTMAARDQHDARFVLAVMSDWPDLDQQMKEVVFQRLNLYAIVANYGWPTAIQASSVVSAAPPKLLLPPGMLPVQRTQQPRRDNNQQRQPRQQQQGSSSSSNSLRLQPRHQHLQGKVEGVQTKY